MTTGTRRLTRAGLALVVALAGTGLQAQAPPDQATPPPQRPAARGGQRPIPPGAELNVQNVQNLVDAWALVQAQKELELSDEQHPNFVARMTRLQTTRRRFMMERQRLMREMRAMVFGSPRPDDAAVSEKVKALDDLQQRSADQVRKLTAEMDAVLTPFQRARFRLFEEQIERQKLDMLMRARTR
jgi:Spy/CpxP family protein refolding chaperone